MVRLTGRGGAGRWWCPEIVQEDTAGYSILKRHRTDQCGRSYLRVGNRFFQYTSTFQLLDKPWSHMSSLVPPGCCLQRSSRITFSNPTARRVSIQGCQPTLSRFPQGNLRARKSPHEFIRVCTRADSSSRNGPTPGSRIT